MSIAGVDLGGTFIKAGLVEGDRVLCRVQHRTESEKGADQVIANIRNAVKDLLARAGETADTLEGIGVAVPAQISPDRRYMVSPPNLRCLKEIPVAERVAQEFGLPWALENDANAAALGEWYYGAGRETNDLVVLTLGTGVGGGVVTEGRLLRGPSNAAAELGHILVDPRGRVCGCGRRGCLEGQIRIAALVERGRELCPELNLDSEDGPRQLAEEAAKGNSEAQKVFAEMGAHLGQGIADLIVIFGPDIVILSGGVSRAFDLFAPSLRESLKENCRFESLLNRTKIVCSGLGADAAILGASAALRDALREETSSR